MAFQRKLAATAEIEPLEVPSAEELARRARYIAAVGKFTKLDDATWMIESEELDETETETFLKQNAFKQIACNCQLFLQEGTAKHRNFRCEHKLALRIYKSLPEMPERVRFNPIAQTYQDLIGTEQQRQLRQMAKNLEIRDMNKTSRARLGCAFDEASREAAQFLIDCLIEIQNS
ncbi:MAG: hypothetical protein M3209_09705 [Acidobacteriota bacterium]|nr:hypothetical protein [Acidobacteriota bacterium]